MTILKYVDTRCAVYGWAVLNGTPLKVTVKASDKTTIDAMYERKMFPLRRFEKKAVIAWEHDWTKIVSLALAWPLDKRLYGPQVWIADKMVSGFGSRKHSGSITFLKWCPMRLNDDTYRGDHKTDADWLAVHEAFETRWGSYEAVIEYQNFRLGENKAHARDNDRPHCDQAPGNSSRPWMWSSAGGQLILIFATAFGI